MEIDVYQDVELLMCVNYVIRHVDTHKIVKIVKKVICGMDLKIVHELWNRNYIRVEDILIE